MDIFCMQHEPKIDPDDASRRGEGIDVRAVDQRRAQKLVAELGVLGQAAHVPGNVVLQQGIVDGRQRGVQLFEKVAKARVGIGCFGLQPA